MFVLSWTDAWLKIRAPQSKTWVLCSMHHCSVEGRLFLSKCKFERAELVFSNTPFQSGVIQAVQEHISALVWCLFFMSVFPQNNDYPFVFQGLAFQFRVLHYVPPPRNSSFRTVYHTPKQCCAQPHGESLGPHMPQKEVPLSHREGHRL